ncbi:MAG TPA: hypothetical protein VNU20_11200 [Candidatus Sulfotelmatobacter sp.]|jgi:hypothetical protein|nr:hypothetical protein [Candidatus Sulfotelmatobacter sp.]
MKQKRLSEEVRRDIAALSAMKDSDIDLTEMPEVLDWSEAEMGKLYRGGKKIIRPRKKAGGWRKS